MGRIHSGCAEPDKFGRQTGPRMVISIRRAPPWPWRFGTATVSSCHGRVDADVASWLSKSGQGRRRVVGVSPAAHLRATGARRQSRFDCESIEAGQRRCGRRWSSFPVGRGRRRSSLVGQRSSCFVGCRCSSSWLRESPVAPVQPLVLPVTGPGSDPSQQDCAARSVPRRSGQT